MFVVVLALTAAVSLMGSGEARADGGYFYAAPSYYVAPPLYYQPYVYVPAVAPVYYAPPVAYYAAPPAGYFYQPAYAVPYGYPVVTRYWAPYRKVEVEYDWNHWHGGWEVDVDLD